MIGNLARGEDGKWGALDSRLLYRHAKTAGFIYQAALRAELTERLGVEWGPVRRGCADLADVPRGLIEHFSQRREEVVDHMCEHGVHSARAAEVAVLETRRSKEAPVPIERLREQWRSRAAEHGLGREAIDALVGRELKRRMPVSTIRPRNRWCFAPPLRETADVRVTNVPPRRREVSSTPADGASSVSALTSPEPERLAGSNVSRNRKRTLRYSGVAR